MRFSGLVAIAVWKALATDGATPGALVAWCLRSGLGAALETWSKWIRRSTDSGGTRVLSHCCHVPGPSR